MKYVYIFLWRLLRLEENLFIDVFIDGGLRRVT